MAYFKNETMKEFFQKNKKAMMIGGAIVGGILIYKLVASKRDKTGFDYENNPNNSGVVYQPNGNVFNAQAVANELYIQMEDSNIDTFASAQLLETIKSRIPTSKMQEVISAFGLKKYYVYQSATDLRYWLKKELDKPHYNIVKNLYNNINWL